MIDMHYDILSIAYYSYLRNDYSYLEKVSNYFNKNNVTGVVANLYFLSYEDMIKEIGEEREDINVLEMFDIATKVLSKYLPNTKIIYSIEGCDFIKDINELEELAKLGLKNILLVWNNPNKYGSGNITHNGLTDLGREFLIKTIDLGISIDMSHMNRETFNDTYELLLEQKKLGKDVKVIASHSNCYELYNHPRNLDDEQILKLKELDAVLGIVTYNEFLDGKDKDYKKEYLKHIKRAVSILGIDRVGVSSDDMNFNKYFFEDDYEEIFNYGIFKKELVSLLKYDYNEEEIDKLLYRNVEEKLF